MIQDYVKWRGLLLYRFLATIVDSDASVRNLGAFTLTQPLITKVSVAVVRGAPRASRAFKDDKRKVIVTVFRFCCCSA